MDSEPALNWSSVALRDPREGIRDNPWFVLTELLYIVCGILLLKHAIREGGRYIYLWLTVVVYAVLTEAIFPFLPDIDNFWHGQATIMLMGQRLPLYIPFLYCSYQYTSVVGVRNMRLTWWAQPFAVGLSCLIFDLSLDAMATKHLFWTWHDTDPNLEDRLFHVPWVALNSFLVFGTSFYVIFYGLHKLIAWNLCIHASAGLIKELIVVISTVLLSFPLGVIFFALYHDPLHIVLHLHSEECVVSLAAVCGVIVWVADRKSSRCSPKTDTVPKGESSAEILLVIVVHYSNLVLMSVFSNPQSIRSTGYHEPAGPCNATSQLYSFTTGKVLQKRKFFCLADHRQPFDFQCAQSQPMSGDHWYTICGIGYSNRVGYVLLTCMAGLIGITWFWQILRNSRLQPGNISQKYSEKQKMN